jgi:hypothetical protein
MSNKLLTLLIAALILIIPSVSASYYCYQESANVSTSCGGYANGTYDTTFGKAFLYNITDGNWSTYIANNATAYWFYTNYTKPDYVLNTSLWQVKLGDTITNISIPTQCWTGYSKTLRLAVYVDLAFSRIRTWCHDGTGGYNQLTEYNALPFTMAEEAMYWNLQSNINLTMYNEQTGQILYGNWSLELWGTNSVSNYSIYTTALITNLVDDTYDFRYSMVGYQTRHYYYKLDNLNFTPLKLYELNANSSLQVLYTITDIASTPLAGYTLVAARKMLTSNQFETVEMSLSDANGQGTLNLEPYTVNYMFSIKNPGGIIVWQSAYPQTIPSNVLYFNIQINPDSIQSYWSASNVSSSINYNNATQNFTFTWSDPGQDAVYGSLIVNRVSSLSTVQICNSTVSGYSGQASCNMAAYANDSTASYDASGWIFVNNSAYRVAGMSRSFSTTSGTMGLLGAFLAFLLIATLAMAGLWNPAAAVILTCVGLIASSLFGLIPISFAYLAGIIFIAVILIWRMRV